MKKIFLLVLILTSPILFNSCSDDDDDKDPIVGQWEIYKMTGNGIPLPIEDDCDFEGVLDFNSDGTFTVEDYEENNSGQCVLDETNVGSWINEGNSIYKITVDGESELIELTFENDTFSIIETEDNITIEIIYKRL